LAPAGLLAQQITGTVSNGTTNKPSSGDEVVLLSLAGGMDEVARTRTDNQGHYTLNASNAPQLLVRVTRESVHYFAPVPSGVTTADVTIYDAATQLTGVAADALVYRMQASGGQMDVIESFSIQNRSQPPRSKIGNETFAVTLPEGAQFMQASVVGPSGLPLAVEPAPSSAKNRFAFDFPIRPGTSKLEVTYKMPYSGAFEFTVQQDSILNELGILLPKSMQFRGVTSPFAQDSDEAGLAVFFAKNIPAGHQVRFSVSGQGVAPRAGETGPATTAPVGAPEGSGNSLWYLLGAMVIVIAAGGVWLWRKSSAIRPAKQAKTEKRSQNRSGNNTPQPVASAAPAQGNMIDILKSELFQLESDRLNGKITREEYEKNKAALDSVLQRQMKK
jgi:hypothetical protein